MTLEHIIRTRGIGNIVHFTRVKNLESIFYYQGLLTLESLDRHGIEYVSNDKYRLDHCRNSVSVSIEFPNYKMFWMLQQENPNTLWAIIEMEPELLVDLECAFCYDNAANSYISNIPIQERKKVEYFQKLFEDIPSKAIRKQMNLPDNYPTSPQAEVLVLGNIPLKYFKAIYFENKDICKAFCDYLHKQGLTMNGIDCRYYEDTWDSYFSPRCDYQYWKKKADD